MLRSESLGAAVLSITEALGQLATGLASQGLREKGRSQAMLVGSDQDIKLSRTRNA